jgi:hypothetical protein
MSNEECRISKLEANHESLLRLFERHIEEERESAAARLIVLMEIKSNQTKMVGFGSGMLFMLTGVASVATYIGNKVWG